MAIVDLTLEELVFAEKPTSSRFIDLTGKTFGRLTVIGYAGKFGAYPSPYWFCVCQCAQLTKVGGSNLKYGQILSCGCFSRENLSKRRKTHGASKTIEYKIYKEMKTRCNNPNTKDYARYGARGIKVTLTFEEFLNEVGKRPSPSHSIDRINNEKNYEKGNLRWSTVAEQQSNRSTSYRIFYQGETNSLTEWGKKLNLSYSSLRQRKRLGYCDYHILQLPFPSKKPKDCPDCNHKSNFTNSPLR